jgi:hypothetical protein
MQTMTLAETMLHYWPVLVPAVVLIAVYAVMANAE